MIKTEKSVHVKSEHYTIGDIGDRVTPYKIDKLEEGQIFVFGSNCRGAHAGGAAHTAMEKFGAIWGQGDGLQGQSYAISTMEGLIPMRENIERFIAFAKEHPELTFLVTRIGCGIAGYKVADVAPMFENAINVKNIWLPGDFWLCMLKDRVKPGKKVEKEESPLKKVASKGIGKLDMVIAFDTTGSMSAYIGAVRQEVMDLIPNLFKDNEDLRLGIVAFGDYCDMENVQKFGNAYQCLMPTDDENKIIRFVKESKDTYGGDGDEFYELVIKKIIEETPWREGSTRSVLLISDADPHPLGYSYGKFVVNNKIDWREEAKKAASKNIRFDTVSITDTPWYAKLSEITGGVHIPFSSDYKTARLVEAATWSRSSVASRARFDAAEVMCLDPELKAMYASIRKRRDEMGD